MILSIWLSGAKQMERSECNALVIAATNEIFANLDYDIKNSKEFFAIAYVSRMFIEDHLSKYDESINHNSQKLQIVYDSVITQLKELVKSLADQIRREETSFLERERGLLRPFLDEQKNEFSEYLYTTLKGSIRKLKTEGGFDLSKEISTCSKALKESSSHLQAKAEQFQNGIKKAAIVIAVAGAAGAIIGSVLTSLFLVIAINTGALNVPSALSNIQPLSSPTQFSGN